ncbi:tobe domain protein [Fulvivirga sp. M361]|uniref:TOBE domain-containing protein n=1 Tax=Fulvivirga sp. M361 TaxID=2594266 RepID=UPI001179E484|nr:tobe domain protein [Fulvivirga sp. M361]TRX58465.1 tobe domain protein [Fulvivirga sp. M361]
MNTLSGEIDHVTVSDHLSLVKVKVGSSYLSAVVIDTPNTADYLHVNNQVKVVFKETEVIVGKGDGHRVSVLNQVKGTVGSIEYGELLSKLLLETEVGLITVINNTEAVKSLNLEKGSPITGLIKTSDIMLSV